jgi:hypothetical protein
VSPYDAAKSQKFEDTHQRQVPKTYGQAHVSCNMTMSIFRTGVSKKKNCNFATDEQIHEQFVAYNTGQIPVVYTDTKIILFNYAESSCSITKQRII